MADSGRRATWLTVSLRLGQLLALLRTAVGALRAATSAELDRRARLLRVQVAHLGAELVVAERLVVRRLLVVALQAHLGARPGDDLVGRDLHVALRRGVRG